MDSVKTGRLVLPIEADVKPLLALLTQVLANPLYLGATLCLIYVLQYIYQGLFNPLSHIPGPWYTRWTTWPKSLQVIWANEPVWIHELHAKYGPVVRISPFEVDITDPKTAARIYGAKDGYLKTPFYSLLITDSSSVFNETRPDVHRRYKRLLSGEMSETGLKKFLPRIDNKVRLAMQRMEDEFMTRGVADVAKWMMFLSFDVIGDLTFGETFGNLERGQVNQSVTDFINLGPVGGIRSMFPTLAWVSTKVPLPMFRAATQIQWRTFSYAEGALARHRARVEQTAGEDPTPTVFSKLYTRAADEHWTPEEVRDNAQVFIVGGSDTTANSMIYLLWSVCRHEGVRARLLADLATLPEAGWGYDDLRHLPYLNHVVDETLRLYSALPCGLPRLVPAGGADLAGHYVPEGCTVLAQAYSLHRNKAAFPDPYAFRPERWENPTQEMKDCTMPFGGGARTCLGRHLARIELRLITARFFLAYPRAVVSTQEGMSDDDMKPAWHFLMVPSGHRCLLELRP